MYVYIYIHVGQHRVWVMTRLIHAKHMVVQVIKYGGPADDRCPITPPPVKPYRDDHPVETHEACR